MTAESTARYTYYDFFAGAGLVHLALRDSWECLLANDIDPRKREIYAANFGTSTFALGDVGDIDSEVIPAPADMAWASFPCQDLSVAGWQGGMSAKRSGAFWAFWRIMAELEARRLLPTVLVIENVQGLLYGDSLSGLCEALAALGLRFGAILVDARHFVPHSRPRVFIVATAVEVPGLCSEGPTDTWWHPPSVRKAYSALRPELAQLWRWWRMPRPCHAVADAADLIDDVPVGVNWSSRDDTERLLALMDARNVQKVQEAATAGDRRVGFVYRRMRCGQQRAEVRFDGIAGCLRVPVGGASRQTVLLVRGNDIRSRLLSPREAARLMGAGEMWLPSHYNQAYKAMGDGVAVPVVRHLVGHLVEPIVAAARLAGDTRTDSPPHRFRGAYHRASRERAAEWHRQHGASAE